MARLVRPLTLPEGDGNREHLGAVLSGFDAAGQRGVIRWQLFLHHEIRDVLLTPRADTLQLLYRGDGDPDAWAATLREAGFPDPRFCLGTGESLHDDAA